MILKAIVVMVLVTGALSLGAPGETNRIIPSQFKCSLSVQLFPLEYTFVTRSVETRIRFLSNCMGLRDFDLEAFFDLKHRFSPAKHPTKVKLRVLGNEYVFSFTKRKNIFRHSILQGYQYTVATNESSDLDTSSNIDVDVYNSFYLKEQKEDSHSFKRLAGLLRKKNPILCFPNKFNTVMNCRIR